jgi:hypothetical protein
MRWMLITLETLATGFVAIIVSLVVFFTSIWKLAIVGILIGIFLFGSGGLLVFSQRVYR